MAARVDMDLGWEGGAFPPFHLVVVAQAWGGDGVGAMDTEAVALVVGAAMPVGGAHSSGGGLLSWLRGRCGGKCTTTEGRWVVQQAPSLHVVFCLGGEEVLPG